MKEPKLGKLAWEKEPEDNWTEDQRLESERHTIGRKDLRISAHWTRELG
jgi:hypothetical protein